MKLKKILHIPWVGKSEFQLKTAISISAQQEIKTLVSIFPDVKVMVYGNQDDWQIDNVEYIPTELKTLEYFSWNPKWENLLKYMANDVLIISHAPMIVSNAYSRKYVPGFQFPKFLIRYHSSPEEFSGYQSYMFLMPSLYFPSIFGSESAKIMQKTFCGKRWMLANDVKWYINHPVPIDIENIGKAISLDKKDVPVIQVSTVNLLDGNGIDVCMEVMDRLYSMGRKFRLHFNIVRGYGKRSDSASEYLKLSERSYLDVNMNPDRDLYFSELKTRDMFLSFANFQTGGVTFIEMLLAGMVGIFWDARYVNEKIGNDYPFVVKSKEEAVSVIDYVMNNLDESKKKIAPIVEKLKKRYHYDVWSKEYIDIVKKVIEHYKMEL